MNTLTQLMSDVWASETRAKLNDIGIEWLKSINACDIWREEDTAYRVLSKDEQDFWVMHPNNFEMVHIPKKFFDVVTI